jgi:SHS2 domain-containing protein
MWLVLEREAEASDDGPALLARTVELAEPDLPLLLRSWIRKLLYWEETEGFVATDVRLSLVPAPVCSGSDGQGLGLRATVMGTLDRGPRVREIKGVTLHGLKLDQVDDAWHGEVILDV